MTTDPRFWFTELWLQFVPILPAGQSQAPRVQLYPLQLFVEVHMVKLLGSVEQADLTGAGTSQARSSRSGSSLKEVMRNNAVGVCVSETVTNGIARR